MLTSAEQLPNELGLQTLFAGLFVPKVQVRRADIHLSASRPFLLANYADGNGQTEAIAICDVNLATILGAALSLKPIGSVDDDLSTRQISQEMLGNAREVFNIASKLFQTGPEQRHFLQDVVHWKEVDDRLMFAIRGRLPKRTFAVEVDRYGTGKVTYVALIEDFQDPEKSNRAGRKRSSSSR
ncbi:MAG: hypothetical protein ACI9G1_000785 [Pirellulaceae bacterium]|jgi:hypothetical protein